MPDEDRLAELEGLRAYLQEGVEAVEAAAANLAAPQDRLRRLLEATDKKATLLEMAGAWVLFGGVGVGVGGCGGGACHRLLGHPPGISLDAFPHGGFYFSPLAPHQPSPPPLPTLPTPIPLRLPGSNEIDRPLIDLLDQNIAGAEGAGQDAAADFMRKVRTAALRYLVS